MWSLPIPVMPWVAVQEVCYVTALCLSTCMSCSCYLSHLLNSICDVVTCVSCTDTIQCVSTPSPHWILFCYNIILQVCIIVFSRGVYACMLLVYYIFTLCIITCVYDWFPQLSSYECLCHFCCFKGYTLYPLHVYMYVHIPIALCVCKPTFKSKCVKSINC